jgi:hypothetical protein
MQIAAAFAQQLAAPARASANGELMVSEPPGPSSIGSDTWPGLAALAADAAQVLQVVRAIIGDGNDTGTGAASLRESLQEELGDLRAAIDYVIGKNALDWDAVNRRRDRKRSLYERGVTEPRAATRAQDAAGSDRPAPRGPAFTGNAVPCPHGQPAADGGPAPRGQDPAGDADPALRGPEAAGTGYLVPCQHARPATARSAWRAAQVRALHRVRRRPRSWSGRPPATRTAGPASPAPTATGSPWSVNRPSAECAVDPLLEVRSAVPADGRESPRVRSGES